MSDGHRSGRWTGNKSTELKRCRMIEMRWNKYEVSLASPVWTQIRRPSSEIKFRVVELKTPRFLSTAIGYAFGDHVISSLAWIAQVLQHDYRDLSDSSVTTRTVKWWLHFTIRCPTVVQPAGCLYTWCRRLYNPLGKPVWYWLYRVYKHFPVRPTDCATGCTAGCSVYAHFWITETHAYTVQVA